MARKRKETPVKETIFSRVYQMEYGNFIIEKGDLVKVQGEYGSRFKFHSVTTNTETGVSWVDCFESYRGQSGVFRSFYPDRIKRIPKKRPRKAKTNVV